MPIINSNQNSTIDKSVLEVQWKTQDLEEIKKILETFPNFQTSLSDPILKRIFDSLFNTYSFDLYKKLDKDFDIFSNPVKDILGCFRHVSNNPSIKKAIQNYKNDIAQIDADYQNKLLVVETEIQDEKNELNDYRDNFTSTLPDSIKDGNFNQVYDSIDSKLEEWDKKLNQKKQELAIEEANAKDKRFEILSKFFSNDFFSRLKPQSNQNNLNNFLNDRENFVENEVRAWWSNNNFTSPLNQKDFFNDFLSMYQNEYEDFVNKAIKEAKEKSKIWPLLPNINKSIYIKEFEDYVKRELTNSGSNIFKKLRDSVYSELKQEMKENKIQEYFNYFLEEQNIIFDEQWRELIQKTNFLPLIEQELQNKLDANSNNLRYKVEVLDSGLINYSTKSNTWNLRFNLIDEFIKEGNEFIEEKNSTNFNLIKASSLLANAKDKLEEFKFDNNFQNMPKNDLAEFLNKSMYIPNNASFNWENVLNREISIIKNTNPNLTLSVSNFQDNQSSILLDLVLTLNGAGIDPWIYSEKISIDKLQRPIFDIEKEKESMKNYLDQIHDQAKADFNELVPNNLKHLDEVKNIQQDFMDSLSRLKNQEIQEIDNFDWEGVRDQKDLEQKIQKLLGRFEQDLRKELLKISSKFEKFKQANEIIEKMNEALGQEVQLDEKLLKDILENPSAYEKIMDSRLLENKETLKKIVDVMKDNTNIRQWIQETTNWSSILNTLDNASSNYKYLYFGAGAFLGSIGLIGTSFAARSFSIDRKLQKVKNSKVKVSSLKTASIFTIFISLVSIGASVVLMLIFFLTQGGF